MGRLGRFRLPRGCYVYVGSAEGRLRSRVRRHLAVAKRVRWNIDHLTVNAGVLRGGALLLPASPIDECTLYQGVARAIELAALVRGFGAHDCRGRCPAHLGFTPRTIGPAALRRAARAAGHRGPVAFLPARRAQAPSASSPRSDRPTRAPRGARGH